VNSPARHLPWLHAEMATGDGRIKHAPSLLLSNHWATRACCAPMAALRRG
jgi:hypothetical protein